MTDTTTRATGHPSEPVLRVGLIGAGGIAHAHLPAWLALGATVRIFALEGASELARTIGGTAVERLGDALTDVDVVDVCTPTPTHVDIATAAMDAGVTSVVCEKPLGRTAEQARQLVAAADAVGAQLYPGHVVRFFAEYAAMHAAVVAGVVGRIAVQRFTRTCTAPGPRWFHDDALSGGIVLDQMIHDLDFARWNAGEVATVFARHVAAQQDAGLVRSATVVLTHVGGAISSVVGTWAPDGTPFRTTFEIAGDAGLLRHDSTQHQPVVVLGGAHPNGTSPAVTGLLPRVVGESPFGTELAEFLAAFRGGPPPRVAASDGVAAIVIAEAALESIRTGRTVSLTATTDRTRAGAHA
ncbi:MAG: Gfo/Idh/MocA family protein [Propionibacteriaceae bacterium]